jgi:hypothetical protein
VGYESRYEKFEVTGPDGQARNVEFKKAGFLPAGDQPELYFFEVKGERVLVGVSGGALAAWQRARRYLSREEKIDLAGLQLKRCIEEGKPAVADNLYVDGPALEKLVRALHLK